MAKAAVKTKGRRKRFLSSEELKASLPKRPLCRVNDWKPTKERPKIECPKEGRSRGLCVNHYNMICRLVRLEETTWEEQEALGNVLPAGRNHFSEGRALFLPPDKVSEKKSKKK